jgi:hypothetical protein
MMQQHDSSVVRGVAYDWDEGTLQIKFVSGEVYTYRDVPEGVYTGMLGAESLGRAFNQLVKGRYRLAFIHLTHRSKSGQ